MKKIILTLLFLGFFFHVTYGQLSVNAGIKYKKDNDIYSEYYYREIELITGKDLNKATKTLNYDQYSDYALVWFDQNEVAIIKLKDSIQPDSDRLLGKPITKTVLV